MHDLDESWKLNYGTVYFIDLIQGDFKRNDCFHAKFRSFFTSDGKNESLSCEIITLMQFLVILAHFHLMFDAKINFVRS